jgi:dihydrofolate reductase
MRKIVVSEGVTLDGVFDAQTMQQWAQSSYSDERDEYVQKIVMASDALLLGRVTYDLQAYYWPGEAAKKYAVADKMNNMPKYVVTSTPLKAQWNNTNIIKNNVVEEIAKLKQQPGKDILIQGSATLIQSLMQAGLIDEYKLMVHPVIAGSGKRLFKDGTGMTKLKLVECKPISLGVVALSYEVTK